MKINDISNWFYTSNKSASYSALPAGFMNYKHLLSTKKLPVDDDEYKNKVIEQAQKDAAQGIFQGKEFQEMAKTYVQAVSPNRVGIINGMFNEFLRNPPTNQIPNAVTQVYYGGELVATYSMQNGWEDISTRAESKRAPEIAAVYNQAWKQASQNNSRSIEATGSFINVVA